MGRRHLSLWRDFQTINSLPGANSFTINRHALFLCLPGYDKESKSAKTWGYDFDVLLKMLHDTVLISVDPNQPFYLIGHDW